jgi:hypothetical protein
VQKNKVLSVVVFLALTAGTASAESTQKVNKGDPIFSASINFTNLDVDYAYVGGE